MWRPLVARAIPPSLNAMPVFPALSVRAIQFAVALTGLRHPRGVAAERLHDRAVSDGPYALTLASQFLQLPLQ